MHNTWIWAASAVTEIWPIFAQNGGSASDYLAGI
jgi:hypothetical protein